MDETKEVAAGTDGTVGYSEVASHFERTGETNFKKGQNLFWVLKNQDAKYIYSSKGIWSLLGSATDAAYIPQSSEELVTKLKENANITSKELLDSIKSLFKDYVKLDDERAYDVLASWIVHSYVPNAFRVTPYLFLSGSWGSGKTTVLELCCRLGPSGNNVLVDPSIAIIYRRTNKEHQALFIDEFDQMNKSKLSDMTGVINSGYLYGGKVSRCGGDDYNDIKCFDVFCPKAFTVIDTSFLQSSTLSRGIELTMYQQQGISKRVEHMVDDERFEEIRAMIYSFLAKNEETITQNEDCEFKSCFGRTAQIAQPLLKVSELLDCFEAVSYWLKEASDTYSENLETTEDARLLKNLRNHLLRRKVDEFRMNVLIGFCTTDPDYDVECYSYGAPSPEKVGRILRRLGLHKGKKRSNGVVYKISLEEVERIIRMRGLGFILPSLEEPSEPSVPAVKEGITCLTTTI